MYTTDFVIAEIQGDEHKEVLQHLINEGSLAIKSFSAPALSELVSFHASQGNLSLPDCPVWQLAGELNAILLPSDGVLRKPYYRRSKLALL